MKDKDTKRIYDILRALEILHSEANIIATSTMTSEKKIDEMRSVCKRSNSLIEIIKNVDEIGYTIAKRCNCEEENPTILADCIKNSIQILEEYFKGKVTENKAKDIALVA